MALFLVYFLFPTTVDCIPDNLPIAGVDVANEKDLDIVLDGDKLRVVDSRFLRDLLTLLRHFDSYRCKSQRRFAVQPLGLLSPLVDNAMLFRLDAVLFASFAAVCKDWPARRGRQGVRIIPASVADVVRLTRMCSGLGRWRPR